MPGMLHEGSDSRSSTESLGSRPPDEQRPVLRRRAGGLPTSEEIDVTTAGVLKSGGNGAAAADPEGGRRAAAHVGDGAREVATTRTCVSNVYLHNVSVDALDLPGARARLSADKRRR